MNDETPTTEDVRRCFVNEWASDMGMAKVFYAQASGDMFDRWKAGIEAAARVQGAEQERAAVVAMLHLDAAEWMKEARRAPRDSTYTMAHHAASAIASVAHRIEAGEHREKEEGK